MNLRQPRIYFSASLGVCLLAVGLLAQSSGATGASQAETSPAVTVAGPVAVDRAPEREINVSTVPDGFSLAENQVIQDPNNPEYEEHLFHYSGGNQAFEVLILTGVPSLDVGSEIASNPGSRQLSVQGRDGVLISASDRGGLNIVEWMLDSRTLVKVVGRAVSDEVLISVAAGVEE